MTQSRRTARVASFGLALGASLIASLAAAEEPTARPGLRPIGTIVLERRLAVIGEDAWVPPADAVGLRETSRKAALTSLDVEVVGKAEHDGAPVAAKLVAEIRGSDDARIIAAGGRGELTFGVSGDFPPGTSKGTLEIRAAELDQPVTAAYEVRGRYDDLWIMPLFTITGLLGWFFRVYLRRVEMLHARDVQAKRVHERLARESARHPRARTREDLERQLDALRLAIEARDAGAIAKEITTAEALLAAAELSHAQDRSDGLTRIEAEIAAVGRPFELPFARSLDALRRAWSAAQEALLADEREALASAEGTARNELASLAREASDTWIPRARRALDAASRASLPALARATLARDGEGARAALAAIHFDFLASPPPPTYAYLRSVHDANDTLRRLAQQLALDVMSDAEAAAAALPAGSEHAQKIRDVGRSIETAAKDPVDRLERLAAAGPSLRHAVIAALPSLGVTRPDPDIDPALADGAYADAIRLAQRSAAPGADASRDIAAGRPFRGLSGVRPESAPAPHDEAPSAPAMAAVAAPRELRFLASHRPNVEVVLAQSVGKLARDRWLSGTLSALLLSLFAWVLYRASWVGSVEDCVGIGAIAFTSDFTLDALLEAVTKAKRV